MRIAIVGERDPGRPNHLHTESALRHSARAVGSELDLKWFATDALLDDAALAELGACDGVWCTTGSPFRSLAGALRAIQRAREESLPFLGTCSGFQHAILEYARNVLGIHDAAHAEYEGGRADALIAPLACSLAGQWFEVELRRGSRAAVCYGAARAREAYFCSYGINPAWQSELLARGLPIVGTDDEGTPRILELPDHPFFVATLFVPQARSTADAPHPLVSGFVRAAALSPQARPASSARSASRRASARMRWRGPVAAGRSPRSPRRPGRASPRPRACGGCGAGR